MDAEECLVTSALVNRAELREWRCVAAALQGRENAAAGRPCADAWARQSRRLAEGEGRLTAVCLADGAGDGSHVALGAHLVARTAARWACRHFQWALQAPPGEVGGRLLTLLQHRLQQAATANGSVIAEFASTLVLVATAPGGDWLAVHLGDGAILARQAGQLLPLSLPQKGELANETFFVTEPEASELVRIYRSREREGRVPVSGFVLFTDGIENQLVNRRTGEVAAAGSKLLRWLDQAPEAQARRLVRETLADLFLPLTNDDCSLALLAPVRSYSSPEHPATGS